MDPTGTIRLIMARPTGGVKGEAGVVTCPGGAAGTGDTEGAEGTDGTACAGGVGGGEKGESATPSRTLGSVRRHSADHLFQGNLGLGCEAEPTQAVFIAAVLRLHLGADDLRPAAEVHVCEPRKEFHAAKEGQSLGEPELQAPDADVLDGANQGLGGIVLAHEPTRHLNVQGNSGRPAEVAPAAERDVQIQ